MIGICKNLIILCLEVGDIDGVLEVIEESM